MSTPKSFLLLTDEWCPCLIPPGGLARLLLTDEDAPVCFSPIFKSTTPDFAPAYFFSTLKLTTPDFAPFR
jgi:hypothetical protein